MPFTPESVSSARHLEGPRVGEIFDVVIDTSYIKSIQQDSIREKHFTVVWPGHNHYFVDPVVEMFIPLRKKYRKEHDLHIGLDAVYSDSSEGRLVYRFVCGTFERKNVDTRIIESELDAIAPRILDELDELFQTWAEADNGLCVYLKDGNVASIHQFLESIGLRQSETSGEKRKVERRKAYLEEHPEHADTAEPRRKTTARRVIPNTAKMIH